MNWPQHSPKYHLPPLWLAALGLGPARSVVATATPRQVSPVAMALGTPQHGCSWLAEAPRRSGRRGVGIGSASAGWWPKAGFDCTNGAAGSGVPEVEGTGSGLGGWAGRAPRSGAAGGSSRNDEEEDLEIGLKEGPSLWRGEWGRGGRSSAPARGLRQGLQGDAHRSLWSSPEASGSQLHSPWGRGRECGLSRVGESLWACLLAEGLVSCGWMVGRCHQRCLMALSVRWRNYFGYMQRECVSPSLLRYLCTLIPESLYWRRFSAFPFCDAALTAPLLFCTTWVRLSTSTPSRSTCLPMTGKCPPPA